jgi:hypothetical protein
VFEECDGDYACATDLYGTWKADKDWWDTLLSAQPGDTLFGSSETTCDRGTCNHASAWAITFGENMTISTESGLSLVDVQAGHVRVEDESSGFGVNIEIEWMGFFRLNGGNAPYFYDRPGYAFEDLHAPGSKSETQAAALVGGAIAGGAACFKFGGLGPGIACGLVTGVVSALVIDEKDLEPIDHRYKVGPMYFNSQIDAETSTWSLEHMDYRP